MKPEITSIAEVQRQLLTLMISHCSWLTARVVTVIVGYEEKRWTVHEKLLVSQSEFFRNHFAQENVTEIRLPREDPRLFALFIRWLYGTAFVPSGGPRNFRFLPPDGRTNTVRD